MTDNYIGECKKFSKKLKSYIFENGYTYNSFDKYIGAESGISKKICTGEIISEEDFECFFSRIRTIESLLKDINIHIALVKDCEEKHTCKYLPDNYSSMIDDIVILCEIYLKN
ncbi:hypothetical protein ACV3UL_08220 [Clostridium perfringens]